ncbi:hypothetical protein V6N13_043986 [Hibiscus sabdariffa]
MVVRVVCSGEGDCWLVKVTPAKGCVVVLALPIADDITPRLFSTLCISILRGSIMERNGIHRKSERICSHRRSGRRSSSTSPSLVFQPLLFLDLVALLLLGILDASRSPLKCSDDPRKDMQFYDLGCRCFVSVLD